MSSLRAAFAQTCNSNNSFCPILSTIANSLGSCFSQQEPKIANNKHKFMGGRLSLSLGSALEGKYKKEIQTYLSLNINTLSQLKDNNSSDFSKQDGVVHVLQLEQDPPCFWEVETVKSMQVSHESFNDGSSHDPNSTRSGSRYQ